MVKNLPALQETQIPYLGQEDPLEEGIATHSRILAWRIPVDRGTWWAIVLGVTLLKGLEQSHMLSHQQCVSISVTVYPHYHLMSFFFNHFDR